MFRSRKRSEGAVPAPAAGVRRLLQGRGGGEHPGQLRHHLRTSRRVGRLRIPANHRRKDPARVSFAPARKLLPTTCGSMS